MVDETRLLRLLRSVTDDVAVLAVEACVDVAQHICASEGWGPPRDNGDAARLLADHHVLAPELGASVRRAVGFRNVLVHEYAEVDDGIVVDRLSDLSDLREYASAVTTWLPRS